MNRTIVRPILPEEMQHVKDAGVLDEHAIIAPTHVLVKDNCLMGCLSVGAVPLIIPWLNTKVCRRFDTAQVMNVVESSLRFVGQRYAAVPVHDKSPLRPYIEPFGYAKFLDCGLYMKVL